MSLRRLRVPRGSLTALAEVSRGHSRPDVGEASEALDRRKAEPQIGQAGNEARRSEREERQVGTRISRATSG